MSGTHHCRPGIPETGSWQLYCGNPSTNFTELFRGNCTAIATQTGKPIYKKAGFRAVSDYFFFRKERPWNTSSMLNEKVKPIEKKFKPQILQLDRQISGENRKDLIIPYWSSGFVYLCNHKIKG